MKKKLHLQDWSRNEYPKVLMIFFSPPSSIIDLLRKKFVSHARTYSRREIFSLSAFTPPMYY